MQARFYDPAIGRFFSIDPVTDGQEAFSPYHYSFNNPIRFSDPDGKYPGEKLVNAVRKWWNTPLSKDQQQISRAASISDTPAKTQGENMVNSLVLGLSHAAPGMQPGSFRRPANMYKPAAPKSSSRGGTASPDLPSPNLVSKQSGPVAGGGAQLENISGEIGRIQNIATKYDLEINVVGSRASGKADNLSDWDYIILGGNAKARSSALFQLPRNLNATKDGMPRPGSEVLKGVNVNPELPHITFKPEQND